MKGKKTIYADVAPGIPLSAQKFQTYTYRLEKPDARALHALVKIPFGKRQVQGVVMRLHTQRPAYTVKPILRVFGVRLSPQQIALGQWIARTMQGGLGFTLRLFFPPAGRDVPSHPPSSSPKKTTTSAKTGQPMQGTRAVYIDAPSRRYRAVKKLILEYVRAGQQVLVLVPEIWMIDILQKKLLNKGISAAPFWAGLPNSEQGRIWAEIQAGRISVVIGTQKAVFLPWRALGLIVLEEEYFPTHKLWDQYPRLDNRLAAPQLAQLHKAKVLYSSSFPSLVLWHEIKEQKVEVLRSAPAEPNVQVMPVSFEETKRRRVLPEELVRNIHQWVRGKERVLMLYNKLGDGGVEMVEEVMGKLSFKGRLARLDAPTIETLPSAKVESMIKRKAVVLGTSAVLTQVAGRQFDRVVWLFPEIGMQVPDFRSYERALGLLARLQQHLPPRRPVVIVTRRPDLIAEQLVGGLDELYSRQLKERQQLGYPPFSDIVKLTISASKLTIAAQRALQVRAQLEQRAAGKKDIVIRGPYRGVGERRRSKVEVHVLLQGKLEALIPLYDGLSVDAVDVSPHQVL